MIDKNKTYKTRDGREVRIYATDGEHGELVHGAVEHKKHGWQSRIWFANGNYYNDVENNLDLIEVRLRYKRTVWVNMCKTIGTQTSHHSRKEADDERDPTDCIGCIKVDLDFEEGEGL